MTIHQFHFILKLILVSVLQLTLSLVANALEASTIPNSPWVQIVSLEKEILKVWIPEINGKRPMAGFLLCQPFRVNQESREPLIQSYLQGNLESLTLVSEAGSPAIYEGNVKLANLKQFGGSELKCLFDIQTTSEHTQISISKFIKAESQPRIIAQFPIDSASKKTFDFGFTFPAYSVDQKWITKCERTRHRGTSVAKELPVESVKSSNRIDMYRGSISVALLSKVPLSPQNSWSCSVFARYQKDALTRETQDILLGKVNAP